MCSGCARFRVGRDCGRVLTLSNGDGAPISHSRLGRCRSEGTRGDVESDVWATARPPESTYPGQERVALDIRHSSIAGLWALGRGRGVGLWRLRGVGRMELWAPIKISIRFCDNANGLSDSFT